MVRPFPTKKAILWDIDGVIIPAPEFFSRELTRQGYGRANDIINRFYEIPEINDLFCGRADMNELFAPVLSEFGWTDGFDAYIEACFSFESSFLDMSLLAFIQKMRKESRQMYICSDQEAYRKNQLKDLLHMETTFDGAFFSSEIGARKRSLDFWEAVVTQLEEQGYSKDYIYYIDDQQLNLDIAESLGITHTFHYTKETEIAALSLFLLNS